MADLPLIARGLHMTVDQLRPFSDNTRSRPKYQPMPLKQDITPDEQEFIEAHRDEFPELETVDEQRRLYPRDGFAAHLIGYVGEVSEDMLNDPRYAYYEPGDVVGSRAWSSRTTRCCAARMARGTWSSTARQGSWQAGHGTAVPARA